MAQLRNASLGNSIVKPTSLCVFTWTKMAMTSLCSIIYGATVGRHEVRYCTAHNCTLRTCLGKPEKQLWWQVEGNFTVLDHWSFWLVNPTTQMPMLVIFWYICSHSSDKTDHSKSCYFEVASVLTFGPMLHLLKGLLRFSFVICTWYKSTRQYPPLDPMSTHEPWHIFHPYIKSLTLFI